MPPNNLLLRNRAAVHVYRALSSRHMLPRRLAQLFRVRKQLEKGGKTPLGRDLEHLSQSPLLKLSLGASSAKGGKAPSVESCVWVFLGGVLSSFCMLN